MKKQNNPKAFKWLLPAVLGGAACVILTALAVWDSLAHHGGRLVYPMDSYSFQSSDIPMLLALALDGLYVLALIALLIGAIASQRKRTKGTNRTRRLNPKLGFLGILGLLGFLGFYSYPAYGMYFPFCFFVFFGFFGFFFEGKMSNTLMDERYRENALRAQRDACQTGVSVIFLLLVIIAGQGRASTEVALSALSIGISLALALTLFLSEYLLYRYDHDGAPEEEEGDA